MVRWVRGWRKEWRDHVGRIEDYTLPKIAINNRPTIIRPRGRLPKRWVECWTPSS